MKILRWMVVLAYAGFIFYTSSLKVVVQQVIPPGVDKLIHVLLYIPLGFVFVWALRMTRLRHRPEVIFLAVGLTILYGMSDEFHQHFVPGREVSLWDIVADSAGGVLGAALAVKMVERLRGERIVWLPVCCRLGRRRS